jgi:hypothetical protein
MGVSFNLIGVFGVQAEDPAEDEALDAGAR